jgi:putative hydrolase of the HAD superfamily
MNPDNIRALLFDFGGVLIRIDFERVIQRWADLARVPYEHVKSRFQHDEAYNAHERGEIDTPEYFAHLRRTLGIGLTDAEFADGWEQVLLPEIEPTVALLPRLSRRIPCHLFSNTNPAHYAVWSRRHARALEPFGRIFVSHELGERKPDTAAYALVLRELGFEPSQVLFLDDTEKNVEGARAAGLPTVHVRDPRDVRQAVKPWLY